MTNIDRMKMLTLAVKDLEEAVKAHEKYKAENHGYYWNEPRHHSREAMKRRITQIRQDLILLEKEL